MLPRRASSEDAVQSFLCKWSFLDSAIELREVRCDGRIGMRFTGRCGVVNGMDPLALSFAVAIRSWLCIPVSHLLVASNISHFPSLLSKSDRLNLVHVEEIRNPFEVVILTVLTCRVCCLCRTKECQGIW
jgi:hypothetical protein